MPLVPCLRRSVVYAVAGYLLLASLGCSRSGLSPAPAGAWSDQSRHQNDSVFVNGIYLNYLDWGGTGTPLILLHGLGDNAHFYDDLVPALGGDFRVIAYSRRGHGRSGKAGPYDTATLVEDLRQLMDSLSITKADIGGWSFSGNELTLMASSHPDRVGRIIYLEAAYDLGDPAEAPVWEHIPDMGIAPDQSLASLDAFRRWQMRTVFPAIADSLRLEAYFRDLVDIQSDGTVRLMAGDSLVSRIYAAGYRRDYTKVRAPALVIAAESYADLEHGDTAQRARNLAWERTYMDPFKRNSLERARRELPSAQFLTVPGGHSEFLLVSRDRVAQAIRQFLGK